MQAAGVCVCATLNEGIRDGLTGKEISEQDLERCRHKGPRQEGRGGSEEWLGAVSAERMGQREGGGRQQDHCWEGSILS